VSVWNGVITSTPAPYVAQDGGVRVAFISDLGTGSFSSLYEAILPNGSSVWSAKEHLGTNNSNQRYSGDPAAMVSSQGRNTIYYRNSANTLYQYQTVSNAVGELNYTRTVVQKGYNINTSSSVSYNTEQAWSSLFVPPGQYKIDMTPSSGDPDLYVKVGGAPTTSDFDCRPYLGTMISESCIVTVPGPFSGYLNVMVRGYLPGTASFTLKSYFNDGT
jgi:hypothetical protein